MGRTPGDIPISMVSALLARQQRAIVQPFYAIPNEVTDIRDPVSRYYTTLRLSVTDLSGGQSAGDCDTLLGLRLWDSL